MTETIAQLDDRSADNQVAVGQSPQVWHRRAVRWYSGKVSQLRKLTPSFRRARGNGMHEIRRDDANGHSAVVAEVSPAYVLVQHHELMDALPEALTDRGIDWNSLDGRLGLTTGGERMELVVNLPMPQAMPRDGFPLVCRLRCVNSVDRSAALEAELQWYRLVCSNGMFGWTGERVRRQHRYADTLEWVQRHLERRFSELPADVAEFDALHDRACTLSNIRDWADVFVARHWGRTAAAEVYHVCIRGVCGAVLDIPDLPPHALPCSNEIEVPGACAPATNLYHVGQALSWVAGQSSTVHTRFARTANVPALLRLLA